MNNSHKNIKKFLLTKKKGYAVTLEVLISILAWSLMLTATVGIINAQRNQKFMYNTFISAATQCSKWGGTNSNMMKVNGKVHSIEDNVNNALNQSAPYLNASITAKPEFITSPGEKITVTMTWTDVSDGFFIPAKTHTISGNFRSVAKSGMLLGRGG